MCKISPCVNSDIYKDGLCWYHWKWGDTPSPTEKKEKKAIAKVSAKRKKELYEYHNHIAPQVKKERPICELQLEGCTQIATDVHHTEGREGKRLNDKEKMKTSCRPCHIKATEKSKQAIEQGHSLSKHKKQ